MKPQLPILLLLSISSSLLHPAASLCLPRTSSDPLNHTSLAAPSSPSASPRASLPPARTSASSTSTNSVSSNIADGGINSIDDTNGFVKSICIHTDYPDVCQTSIQSLIPSQGNADDAASMLSLQIKALSNKTETVRSLAAKLVSDPSTNADAKDSYGIVLEFYDDALDNLEAAATALATRDKGTIDSMLSAVITNFSDVEDEVGGSEETSPLSTHDEVLRKMTSNSLAVAKLV